MWDEVSQSVWLEYVIKAERSSSGKDQPERLGKAGTSLKSLRQGTLYAHSAAARGVLLGKPMRGPPPMRWSGTVQHAVVRPRPILEMMLPSDAKSPASLAQD
eukprot:scaffold112_cov282-Prasinococcus_capsulatus_cf.AAC.11